jgi:RNA 2',3'-cyclic 3'-phosphodiesterase
MSDDRLRLFLAVSVPNHVLRAAADAVELVRDLFPGARWTDMANQHVTLKFLGWSGAGLVDGISHACRAVAVAHAPAELALTALDAFPGRSRVRVLWVGLDDPAGLLSSLASSLDDALEPLGFPKEERAFTPHLTLARFKAPARVRQWHDVRPEPSPWMATGIDLWRSRLSPSGGRYELIQSFDFAKDGNNVASSGVGGA